MTIVTFLINPSFGEKMKFYHSYTTVYFGLADSEEVWDERKQNLSSVRE